VGHSADISGRASNASGRALTVAQLVVAIVNVGMLFEDPTKQRCDSDDYKKENTNGKPKRRQKGAADIPRHWSYSGGVRGLSMIREDLLRSVCHRLVTTC